MILSTTQCRRPYYTAQFLESLSQCKNIEKYKIVVSIDGDNKEVIDLCNKIDFCHKEIIQHNPAWGINRNTFNALYNAAIQDDYVLHMEEDNLLGKHVLEIAEWIIPKMNSNIFSTSFYHQHMPHINQYNTIGTRDTFVSVGPFLTTRAKIMEAHGDNCFGNEWSYDINIDRHCKRLGYQHYFTMLGQSNNIGALEGRHVPSPEWHAENQFCREWANTVDFELGELRLA